MPGVFAGASSKSATVVCYVFFEHDSEDGTRSLAAIVFFVPFPGIRDFSLVVTAAEHC